MRVILFRHGPAGSRDADKWPDDSERPLTARGEEKTLLAAHGIARLEDDPDLILTSPLKRAKQTADLLRQAYGDVEVEVLDALSPGGSARTILSRLASLGEETTVALVGHEPDLGRLGAAMVMGLSPGRDLPLRKAGACAVLFTGTVRAGGGELHWLLPPKILRRVGRKRAKRGARA